MEGFTIVDGGVVMLIVMSALLAYSRGVVREIMAIGGWILAAVLGFVFADLGHRNRLAFGTHLKSVRTYYVRRYNQASSQKRVDQSRE